MNKENNAENVQNSESIESIDGAERTENEAGLKNAAKAKKKPNDGFVFRLAYAVGLCVLTVIFLILAIFFRATNYSGNSFMGWLKARGHSAPFAPQTVNIYGVRLDDGRDGKLYIEKKVTPYLIAEATNDTKEATYVFASENFDDKTFTFSNENIGTITVRFENVDGYGSFTQYNGWQGDGYSEMVTVFFSVSGALAALCALQFVSAFLGKKFLFPNYISIITGIPLVPLYGIGAVAILGGVRGAAPLRAAKKAKKAAEEQRLKEEAIANRLSTFTGGAFMNALIGWVAGFVTLITLGICYPFMACWKLKWKAKHTFIDGRQQYFDGNGLQFFGRYMLLMFLSVITLGIYYMLCAKVAIEKWRTLHTHFVDEAEGAVAPDETAATDTAVQALGETAAAAETADNKADAAKDIAEEKTSKFDGRWFQLLGVNWLCNFVTLITLSFGQYWAHCYKERWFCKHRTIDGVRLEFDGKAMQYFGKRLLWQFLTVITLGVFVFWLKVKTLKWTVSHTHIVEEPSAETEVAEQP